MQSSIDGKKKEKEGVFIRKKKTCMYRNRSNKWWKPNANSREEYIEST